MKPLIGINMDIVEGKPTKADIQSTYYEAIIKAGGIPILLPPMPEDDLTDVMKQLKGIMLIGGWDYDPQIYGEDQCETVHLVAGQRQDFDLALTRKAVKEMKPLLGICAGCQLLNIALGGSLIQDIMKSSPTPKIEHSSQDGWKNGFTRHAVKIASNSKLSRIYEQNEVEVPTSHHQAVKSLGTGLAATAYAHDGIIEAVEYSSLPFTLGVQWHPERDFEGNKRLFESFIEHAAATT